MRIATWNINGLRARLDYVMHWLRERQPDVVGFQELKMTDELFPAEAFAAEGYSSLTHGQKAWNGVAILSRQPATLVQRGLPGQEASGARLITAQIEGLSFTTVYCPNGKSVDHDDYQGKLDWFDALVGYAHESLGGEAERILCGDFNICPTPLDTWDEAAHVGQIFHTDAERARMQALCSSGLHDAFRSRYPDTRAYSWWDYRAGSFQRNHGLRIDFMLASEATLKRLTHVEIDRDYRKKKDGLTASDHAPVIVDLA